MQPERTPLLRTKLDVPRPCAHMLARERLLVLMPSAQGTRLVLLCAPAGFGKTSLLAAWCRQLIARRATNVAWLALEPCDNDPARFVACLAAALAQALPPGMAEALDSLGAGEKTLTRLVNELAALDRDLVLVLDDYHAISAPAVHAAVAFLLDHLPSRVCLAIGSRSDPPLPLARLRARDQLIDLRAAELRFTPGEIQAFLAARDLAISADEAHAIGAYVEGWPAGVQLVSLALCAAPYEAAEAQPQPLDTPASPVLARLHTSEQYLFAYLADDVFEHLPAHRKAFLLQTAILDRMCGPLCDAVLGITTTDDRRLTTDSSAPVVGDSWPLVDSYSRLVLEGLERDNLFVVPLGGQRGWYRYHQPFRAFLRARLGREPALAVAELHRRASVWYQQHELPERAADHALAAGDPTRAGELLESCAAAIAARGEYATLHRRLAELPEPIVAERPALCLWAAWAALLAGEGARAEPVLGQGHLARQAHASQPEDSASLRAGSLMALGAGQLLAGELAAAGATLQNAYLQCRLKRQVAQPLLAYVGRLLAAFPGPNSFVPASAAPERGQVTFAEPLSARELEVLQLLAGGASNQAIAATLVISIGTVKSHINHILGKLAASNRTEAVSRARALGLLAGQQLVLSVTSAKPENS